MFRFESASGATRGKALASDDIVQNTLKASVVAGTPAAVQSRGCASAGKFGTYLVLYGPEVSAPPEHVKKTRIPSPHVECRAEF